MHKAAEPEVQESVTWKIIDSQKTKLLVRRKLCDFFVLLLSFVFLVCQLPPYHSASIKPDSQPSSN